MKTDAIILAAGQNPRWRGPKALARLEGETFLGRVISRVRQSKVFSEVVVVCGGQAGAVEAEAKNYGAKVVVNPDLESGVHGSLRRGLAQLSGDTAAAAFLLVDQPHLEAMDYARLVHAFRASEKGLVRPMYRESCGHPAVIAARHFPRILARSDENEGCHYLFREHPEDVAYFEAPHAGYLWDFDTPEQLEKYKKVGWTAADFANWPAFRTRAVFGL